MKNRVFSSFAVILMALSYQNQDVLLPEPVDADPGINGTMKEMIITAETEGPSQDTRTSLVIESDNSTKVLWTPGDEIKVFSAGESAKFTAINTEHSRKAKFRGTVSMIFGEDEAGGEKDYVWGLYPYREDATYSEPDGAGVSRTAVITTTIPSVQEGKPGTFADNVATMIGRSEASLLISYKNAYSGVFVRFDRDDIVSVTLRGLHYERLAGTVKLGLDSNQLPYVKDFVSGEREITITDSVNGTFVPGENYFLITLPDVNLQEGYSLTVTRDDGMEATFNSLPEVNKFIRNEFRHFKNPLDTYIQDEGNIESGRSSGWRSTKPQDNEIFYRSSGDYLVEYTVDSQTGNEVLENIAPKDNLGLGIVRFKDPVVAIDQNAFRGKANLLEVTLPETVETIKSLAFMECHSLKVINMGDNVEAIMYRAFCDCRSLESIRLPESLFSLEYEAFSYCTELKEITIPESVYFLGVYQNVGFFGNPFSGCTNLSKFNGKYASADGRCLIVPLDGNNSNIAFLSFASAGLNPNSTYVIPEGVTSIRYAAFEEATMMFVTLPEGLTRIDDYAFYDCGRLRTISLPSTVRELGSNAFDGCYSLNSIVLNMPALPYIRSAYGSSYAGHMFDNTGDCPIYVPFELIDQYRTTDHWSDYATRYVYEQPANEIWYTTEGDVTLEFTNAEKTALGIIGERYDAPELTDFPKGVIIFRNDMTSVPDGMFKNRTNLRTVTLSKSTTEIGNEVFMGCTGLRVVTLDDVSVIGDDAFNGCTSLLFNEDTYGEGAYEVFSELTTIGARAFYGCTSLNNSLMSSVLRTIGDSAFEGSSLPGIRFNGITDLGAGAFKNCTGLTDRYNLLGGLMTEIKESTFEGCINLKVLGIAGGTPLKTIGTKVFHNCKGLETIGKTAGTAELSGVETIGEGVFEYTKIARFELPDLKTAGTNAFTHMDHLGELSLPGIVSMGYDMFTPRSLVKLHLGENIGQLTSRLWQYSNDSSTQTFEVELYLDKPSMVNVGPGYTFVTKNSTNGVQILKVKAVYVPSGLVDTYKASTKWQQALTEAGATVDAIQPMPAT